LRGTVIVREVAGGGGNVVSTPRPARVDELPRGSLFRLANDARWTVEAAEPGTVLLAVATSVPREVGRVDRILALAARRPHMAPRRLFGNESVRLEFTAARGRLPLRGWVPYDHTAETVEVAIILQGAFRVRVAGENGTTKEILPTGTLLRIPPGRAHNFAASGKGLCVGLILSAVRAFWTTSPPRDEARAQARGFDPFSAR
jgi:mannose-6-phosphate isomerase-like protein (cupin superfamily)